jgi:prophage DNA circulation protein
MALLEELFPASFRGVPFLTDSTNTSGGRKTVTHEFVNSSRRNVEDLGKLLKTFNVTGVVTGANYLQDRDRLIGALEQSGKGVLSHPFFGRVEVVAKPYSVAETQRSLGEAVFTMVFELADDQVLPQPAQSSTAQVSDTATIAIDALATDVADFFSIPSGFTLANAAATSLMADISANFAKVEDLFSPVATEVAEFSSSLQEFTDDTAELLNNPSALGNDIKGLFAQTIALVTSVPDRLEVLQEFFGFNDTSDNLFAATDVGNAITAEQAQLITNEQMLTRQMRITSLVQGYNGVAQTEFTNTDELDAAQAILEAQFQAVFEDPNTPTGTREALQDVRDQAETLIQARRLTINQVLAIEIKRMPAQVLAYSLYGDLDRAQELVDLNDDSDVSHYEGIVKVLTA